MMKKLTLLLLALVMVLSLVSCGLDIGGMIDDGGDDGDGDGDGDDNYANLPIDRDESEQLMKNLAQTDGYEITFLYGENEAVGTYAMLCKGDVFCLTAKDEDGYEAGTGIVFEDDKCHLYRLEDGEWTFQYTAEGSEAEEYRELYTGQYSFLLYYGNTFDGMLKKGKSAKIAGRDCTIYTFDYNVGGAIGGMAGLGSYSYKAYVDDALGITLKLEFEVSQQGESGTIHYEITSFKTGSAVTVPTFPEPVLPE